MLAMLAGGQTILVGQGLTEEPGEEDMVARGSAIRELSHVRKASSGSDGKHMEWLRAQKFTAPKEISPGPPLPKMTKTEYVDGEKTGDGKRAPGQKRRPSSSAVAAAPKTAPPEPARKDPEKAPPPPPPPPPQPPLPAAAAPPRPAGVVVSRLCGCGQRGFWAAVGLHVRIGR
jgi:hypothetical protein